MTLRAAAWCACGGEAAPLAFLLPPSSSSACSVHRMRCGSAIPSISRPRREYDGLSRRNGGFGTLDAESGACSSESSVNTPLTDRDGRLDTGNHRGSLGLTGLKEGNERGRFLRVTIRETSQGHLDSKVCIAATGGWPMVRRSVRGQERQGCHEVMEVCARRPSGFRARGRVDLVRPRSRVKS